MRLLPSISKAHEGTNRTPQAACLTSKGLLTPGKHALVLQQFQCFCGAGMRERTAVRKSQSSLSWWKGFAVPTSALGEAAVAFSDARSSNLPPDLGGQKQIPCQGKFFGRISTLLQEQRVRETLSPGFTPFDSSLM